MRRRIVGLAVLAAVLATGLFGVPLAIGAASYYLSDETAELEHLADTAAIQISPDLTRGVMPERLPESDGEAVLGLYARSGARILGNGPDRIEQSLSAALSGTIARGSASGDLLVAVPVMDNREVFAVLRAATARSQVYARTLTTWLLMLGLGGLAVVLTWIVARRQAGRLAGPLESFARTADSLGEGDFSVRSAPTGIAEIDTAGQSLNSTAKRLGTLLARERAFSADASHQLRTPLTGLRLNLETAREAAGNTRVSAQAIDAALVDVDRLERTISDLLSLARPATGGQPLHLAALLEEIRADWHVTLAAAGRPLRVVQEPELPATGVQTAAVRQVLTVLLDNAVKHGRGIVTVTARDAGGFLALDVGDEGTGAGPLQAFDPAVSPGHHGHGLELARSLAEAEGGRLVTNADSAVFTLLLPASA